MVVGGHDGENVFASSELYDPATGTWAPSGALSTPRYDQATTALSTGDILVAGGYLSPSVLNPSVELYRP
nr:kelch repeat-containing protein [Corallococcus exiguus]